MMLSRPGLMPLVIACRGRDEFFHARAGMVICIHSSFSHLHYCCSVDLVLLILDCDVRTKTKHFAVRPLFGVRESKRIIWFIKQETCFIYYFISTQKDYSNIGSIWFSPLHFDIVLNLIVNRTKVLKKSRKQPESVF